jgi:hypothetical protein
MVVYLIGLVLLIAIVGAATDSTTNRRYYRNADDRHNYRRRPTRRRGRYDDDYDYDDRDNYYDRERRGGYRGGDRYYPDADHWATYIGLIILVLVGLGIYWYNHTNQAGNSKRAKIELIPDSNYGSSVITEDQTKGDEQIPDDYDDYNQRVNRVDDYDKDVGFDHDDVSEDRVESEDSTSIPEEVVPGKFYAQTNAFGSLENAVAEQQKWIDQGEEAKIIYFKKGDGLYHVLVGAYPSERAAKSFKGKKYNQIYELIDGQYYDLD